MRPFPLPSIDLKVFLGKVSRRLFPTQLYGEMLTDRNTYFSKVGRHDCAICKLAARKRLQRLAGRFWSVVLNEDLADAVGLPATAAGAGNFNFEDRTVLLAFLFHVLNNF